MSGQQLAEELHRTIIKKDKKRKLQSPFKDNIWGADLAGMQWISKFNKGFRFLLCVIDIVNIPGLFLWKIRKAITNAFQKILKESNHQQNKIWVEEGNEFYNGLMRWWLEKNDIEIYSTHNENLFLVRDLLEY